MIDQNQTCIRAFADKVQIDNCRNTIINNENSFEKLSQLLALAGNEVRLKILYLLEEEGELCPCDLSDILNMSVPAISQHLRKLKDRNVIQGRRESQTIFYSIKTEQLDILRPLFKQITNFSKQELV
ncbi:ArsR/SmtB family transcription factor [Mesohalobacter salilacus]|uniref:ArsR/SmtB family transcription factor n=1 Tax=Mesohalobacter salilacus TaxID=2491711 RepID=UPI002681CE74